MAEPLSPRLLALLALGIVSIAFASILIRAADAPALSVAFYRNLGAAAILLPIALVRHPDQFRSLSRREWGTALLAGALLAVHFGSWVPSLALTTVAASTVLVDTQPVWVTIVERAMGVRVPGRAVVGIALAVLGAVLISGGDFAVSGKAVVGDLLAVLGAVAGAGYIVAGRRLRQVVSLTTYTGIVYSTCAALLAGAVAVSGSPFTGFTGRQWWLLALMTLIPQFGGHTVFNYLLGHLEAGTVAIAVAGEPVVASVLAFLFFDEVPGWAAVAGGIAILAGIWVVIRAQGRARTGPAG